MKLLIVGLIVGLVLAVGCFFGGMQTERAIHGNSLEVKMIQGLHDEHIELARKLDELDANTSKKLDEISDNVKAILKIASRPPNPDITLVDP